MTNPYKQCPIYITDDFELRLVELTDAEELLNCYSDKLAVSRMNDDNCIFGFYIDTLENMQNSIRFWLKEYEKEGFARLTIRDKHKGIAVGTVEIFGGEYGCLRVDICSPYEKEMYLKQIFSLVADRFMKDFSIKTLVSKVVNSDERLFAVTKLGFMPSDTFRPGLSYYEYRRKPISYCGLACFLCSNKECIGCESGGCDIHSWCKNYNCCKERGLSGCFECTDFPCTDGMLDKVRIRAFSRFIKEYGKEQLIYLLARNDKEGLKYHYPGKIVGDYDIGKTEEEVFDILVNGCNSKFL